MPPKDPDHGPPQARRDRAAALRAQAASAERRRRLLLITVVGVIAAAVIAGITIAVVSSGGGTSPSPESAGIPTAPMKTSSGRTTSPPWGTPDDPSARVAAAGLPMLGEEGNVEHIHAHLDVIVNGKPVAVPPNIGVDQRTQQISPLHTHAADGVIHVESPVKATFSLGQFMTEWDVALTAQTIGALKAGNGNVLHAYVNGKERPGDPSGIELRAHDEIAIVYRPTTTKVTVPDSYDWPPGE
ncbi:hypothetical protein ACFW7J_10130 [Streptomyces sp. NPDC059525]|uniref:hypothetical protein n=1 Tax=Streptomyces sp. NPDC059525 TaxID=3346857 RepID=UPI0036B9C88B